MDERKSRRRWPFVAGSGILAAALTLTMTPAGAAVSDFLTSPDGSRFEVVVDNDGKLSTVRRGEPTATPTASPTTSAPPSSSAPSVAYAGTWQKNGTDTYTNSRGATATVKFTGTGVTVTGFQAGHHTNAAVSIDGKSAGSTSSKATTRKDATIFTVSGLSAGEHTLVITAAGTVSITGVKLGGTSSATTAPTSSTPSPTTSTPSPSTSSDPDEQPTVIPTPKPGTGGIAKLTVSGNEIQANGQDTWFVGYNSFTLNTGCGTGAEISAARSQGKRFIDSMRQDGHGILRLWYFSNYPTSVREYTKELVDYAASKNIYTILTLSDGQKHCGNGGPNTLSESHVNEAATRFKDNHGIAWFEVANEPTGSQWAEGFLDKARNTGTWIKAVDGDRLVGTGTQASYFLGGDDRQRQLNALSVIDIASMHGYESGCDESRVNNEIKLAGGKPVGMGEFGIDTNGSDPKRAETFACKIKTWSTRDGFAYAIAWAYQPGSASSGYGTLDRDQAAQKVLREASLAG